MPEQPEHEEPTPAEDPLEEGAAAMMKYAEAVEEGRKEDADEAMVEFMQELGKFIEEHKEDPHMLLLDKANDMAEAGDWAGAEAAWREAIDTSQSDMHSILPHQRLVNLFTWLGRKEEALAQARVAAEAARRGDLDVLRSMTMEMEAQCLFDVGDAQAAISRAQEAMEMLGPERIADPIRARLHVSIARYRLALDDPDGARRELDAAEPLLDADIGSRFDGPDLVRGSWWAVVARLRRLNGDVEGAVEAWEQAAACRRGDTFMDPGIILKRLRKKTLAAILRELGRDRQALGDLAGAEEAFAEARSLYREVGLPEQRPSM